MKLIMLIILSFSSLAFADDVYTSSIKAPQIVLDAYNALKTMLMKSPKDVGEILLPLHIETYAKDAINLTVEEENSVKIFEDTLKSAGLLDQRTFLAKSADIIDIFLAHLYADESVNFTVGETSGVTTILKKNTYFLGFKGGTSLHKFTVKLSEPRIKEKVESELAQAIQAEREKNPYIATCWYRLTDGLEAIVKCHKVILIGVANNTPESAKSTTSSEGRGLVGGHMAGAGSKNAQTGTGTVGSTSMTGDRNVKTCTDGTKCSIKGAKVISQDHLADSKREADLVKKIGRQDDDPLVEEKRRSDILSMTLPEALLYYCDASVMYDEAKVFPKPEQPGHVSN